MEQIGKLAGDVWRYLESHGEIPIQKLRKELDIDSADLHLALGWLAREDKLRFDGDGRKRSVGLK